MKIAKLGGKRFWMEIQEYFCVCTEIFLCKLNLNCVRGGGQKMNVSGEGLKIQSFGPDYGLKVEVLNVWVGHILV